VPNLTNGKHRDAVGGKKTKGGKGPWPRNERREKNIKKKKPSFYLQGKRGALVLQTNGVRPFEKVVRGKNVQGVISKGGRRKKKKGLGVGA